MSLYNKYVSKISTTESSSSLRDAYILEMSAFRGFHLVYLATSQRHLLKVNEIKIVYGIIKKFIPICDFDTQLSWTKDNIILVHFPTCY